MIKTKNRSHPVNKVKNLGYDRWLLYEQPRQESGLCCFLRVICRSMETPCLCLSEGHKHDKHGGGKVTETSVTEFCYFSIALAIRNIEINASSSASTVQLAKTKAITLLLTSRQPSSGRNCNVTQRKSVEIQTRRLYCNKKNRCCRAKTLWNVKFL